MKAECIICFESTAQAIMAEKALLDAAFRVRVMPKPAVIQAGCGFCLRFLPDDIEKAVAFLAECGVAVSETYLMEEAGGTVSYTKSPLPASVRPIIASRQGEAIQWRGGGSQTLHRYASGTAFRNDTSGAEASESAPLVGAHLS